MPLQAELIEAVRSKNTKEIRDLLTAGAHLRHNHDAALQQAVVMDDNEFREFIMHLYPKADQETVLEEVASNLERIIKDARNHRAHCKRIRLMLQARDPGLEL